MIKNLHDSTIGKARSIKHFTDFTGPVVIVFYYCLWFILNTILKIECSIQFIDGEVIILYKLTFSDNH